MTQNVILFHGFTQTRHSWGNFLYHLEELNIQTKAKPFRFITFDLPGHGNSKGFNINYDTIYSQIDKYLPAHFLGYSLGGRIVAKLVADHFNDVSSLTLISTSLGIVDEDERTLRRSEDEQLAETLRKISFKQFHNFIDDWVKQPIFGNFKPSQEDLNARYTSNPKKLAESLLTFGQGNFIPLWNKLEIIKSAGIKVLLIAGYDDPKYLQYLELMSNEFGSSAQQFIVNNASHAPHLEYPIQTAEVVFNFLTNI